MARVLIATGGTGGHVYPALATAEVLRERGHEVTFVGGRRLEATLVPQAGFPLHQIPGRGLERSLTPRAAVTGLVFLRSLRAARRVVRRLRPDVVLGLGGYVSLAPCLVAGRARVPVVLHEQNAVLALANRLALRYASALALSLPLRDGDPRRDGLRVEIVGNPLRPVFAELAERGPEGLAALRPEARRRLGLRADATTILVFGGSLGARPVNEAMPVAAGAWAGRQDVQVLHLAGPDHETGVRRSWESVGVHAVVLGYLEAMQDAYAACDVVVSRSGGTVSEFTALGLPSVLVPLPFAPGGHQEANARVLERAGAARVVLQGEPDLPGRLRQAVAPLVDDVGLRAGVAAAARGLGRPRAAATLADLVESALGPPGANR